jgi:hypothetical protein
VIGLGRSHPKGRQERVGLSSLVVLVVVVGHEMGWLL